MNFALPAILLFLIVLPGFMFRSRLKLVEQTTLDYSPFGRAVAGGVLWAITLHLVWLVLTYALGWTLRPDALIGLLSSSPQLQDVAVAAVSTSALRVLAYFLSLYAFALFVPPMVRSAISRWGLDRADARFASLFRFSEAPWYYLLTGADFVEPPSGVSVAAVVDVGGHPYLYVGILVSFFFDATGQLDRLVLESVARRPLSRDKPGDDDLVTDDTQRFYEVEGTYFVLRYAEIVTLNVKYFRLEPIEEGTMQDEPAASEHELTRTVR
jgi:hypothetical protein